MTSPSHFPPNPYQATPKARPAISARHSTMAISTTGPRSVSDATRFTSTTPRAESKSASPSLATSSTSQTASSGRFSRAGAAGSRAPPGGRPSPSPSPLLAGETPEQRVARLRAAHEAAKRAQSSKLDVIISRSRRFFDTAHKATVLGLIGFTGQHIPTAECPATTQIVSY